MRVAALKGNNGPAPPPVWALIEVPEGITNEEFLKPSNQVRTDHEGMTVILPLGTQCNPILQNIAYS